MSIGIAAAPQPPVQLWGLWVVSDEQPDGFWRGHSNGPWPRFGGTPATYLSRKDAEAAAVVEEEMAMQGEQFTVALIGVAPSK
jgi:hypothetical protein